MPYARHGAEALCGVLRAQSHLPNERDMQLRMQCLADVNQVLQQCYMEYYNIKQLYVEPYGSFLRY